jgi:hypothetical protein
VVQDDNLDDQFADKLVMTLIKPRLFCNPVNKNGEGINDPSTHLACYGVPLFTTLNRNRNQITPTDQFGELALDLRTRPENFCVPTLDITQSREQSAGAASPALRALPAVEIDDYTVYRSSRTRRTPRFEPREVNLVDQWIDRDVKLTKPARFGTPAKFGGSDYVNEEAKLTCYQIRKFGKFKKRDVYIQNEFGQEQLTVRKPQLLCVPSVEPVIENGN